MTQLDFYQGDSAEAQGAINGEIGVFSMAGCTIGGYSPVTTRELFSFKEVLTSYGGGYWADRFHLFLDSTRKHHSDFQLRLIRNYKIRPLPSGRALTNQEVLIKTIPFNYSTPDMPEETLLSKYVIVILRDTYGTSNILSVQLGFPRFCRAKHLHILLTEIQSFPIQYAAAIIRKFLQKYPAMTVHAWRLGMTVSTIPAVRMVPVVFNYNFFENNSYLII